MYTENSQKHMDLRHLKPTHYAVLANSIRHYRRREKNFLDRQRQLLLTYYYFIIIIIVMCYLSGLVIPTHRWLAALKTTYLLTATWAMLGYTIKRVKLKTALRMLLIGAQVVIATDMAFCAYSPDDRHLFILNGLTILMLLNLMLSLLSYQRILSALLAGSAVCIFTVCTVITGSPWLAHELVGVFTTFTLLGFLGYGMIKKTENIQQENVTIKKEEAAMLNVLRIKKKQFNAFIELAQREMTGKDTDQLFEILDDAAQRNVIANVNRYLLEKELKEKKLNVVFQELSTSEIEVCRLILQKKKLTEICKILNKNESNVTTHRAHIRKKLGLEKTDDLYETLRQRMDMAVPAQP